MNYQLVLNDITSCMRECGRDPNEVTLVVVSKNHSWEEATLAYDQGCRDFGENRVQEILPKKEVAPVDVKWHFIGTLQSNKVRKVVGNVKMIHSVDHAELAVRISEVSEELSLVTDILLQVNVSGEDAKHGLSPDSWHKSYLGLLELPGIRVVGLMTMAPLTEDEEVIRGTFSGLRKFRDELLKMGGRLPHLSMGMSHDYRIAIEEGATLLRIGTAVF